MEGGLGEFVEGNGISVSCSGHLLLYFPHYNGFLFPGERQAKINSFFH